MNALDMLRQADLTDHTDRLILADALEDAGRPEEAKLLRCLTLPLVYCTAPSESPWIVPDIWYGGHSDLQMFFVQYLDCILFTEIDESGYALEKNYNRTNFSTDAIICAWKDCEEFVGKHSGAISVDPERAGRNFWWNRNGHGVGFWCNWNDYTQGLIMDTECEVFGECYAYVGDDGLIHLQ